LTRSLGQRLQQRAQASVRLEPWSESHRVGGSGGDLVEWEPPLCELDEIRGLLLVCECDRSKPARLIERIRLQPRSVDWQRVDAHPACEVIGQPELPGVRGVQACLYELHPERSSENLGTLLLESPA
jgi:hypothetical protein